MKYVKTALCLFLLVTLLLSSESISYAQGAPLPQANTYEKARVVDIIDTQTQKTDGYTNITQTMQIVFLDGTLRGKSAVITQGGLVHVDKEQLLKKNDAIIVGIAKGKNNKTTYAYVDKFRLDQITWILFAFFALVVLIAGKKGIGAVAGLVISLGVILFFIIPQILSGHDPLLISIGGSLFIMITTMYLAHGFSRQTTVAVVATFLSLCISGLLAIWFVTATYLTGAGNEDAYMLQFGQGDINLKGLLLGGIIIGTLGILDDSTTAQTATVFELAKAGKQLLFWDLFKRGFRIGQEHVASLVNTLVLAYAGASLALFILFVLNPTRQPYWVILNSEIITEEVVRTLAGSIGLVLAVPLTTLLASWYVTKRATHAR